MSLGRGVARDLEVFETPDPIEGDLYTYQDDQQSEAVRQLEVSVQGSYKKFKGKTLDPTAVDFSDQLGRPTQYGFRADPEDYEMVPVERETETLMQRYHRLKQEVAELASDVGRVRDAQESSEKLLEVSPADLSADLEALQRQLHGLQLDRTLGTQLLTAPEHPYQAVLLRDLKAQIGRLQSSEGPQGAEQPTYEVFTRPETAKFAHLSKLSEIEDKLTQLEAVVGNKDTAVSTVAAGLDAEQKDLSSAVLNLQAKVALLDAAHINTIAVQLQALLSLLEQVEEKEDQTTDTGKGAKVADALDTVGRLAAVAPLVPELVGRLHTLKDLHERAAQFAGSVAYMSDSQEQLSKQIAGLQSLLSKVQDSLQTNLSTVQSNFTALESRLSALQT